MARPCFRARRGLLQVRPRCVNSPQQRRWPAMLKNREDTFLWCPEICIPVLLKYHYCPLSGVIWLVKWRGCSVTAPRSPWWHSKLREDTGCDCVVAALSSYTQLTSRTMSVKCWEIILAKLPPISAQLIHMLIGLFPLGSVCNSKSLPVFCRAVNQCNPGDAGSGQLTARITSNCNPLQHRTPMGHSQSAASPTLCVSSPAGLWSDSLCLPPIKNI